MADRQSALKPPPPRPDLDRLIEDARAKGVSEDQLQEQRASFAYGNAPEDSGITKESARRAASRVRMVVA